MRMRVSLAALAGLGAGGLGAGGVAVGGGAGMGGAPTFETLVEFAFDDVRSFQVMGNPNEVFFRDVDVMAEAFTVAWSGQLTTFGASTFGESGIRMDPPGGQQGFFFYPAGLGTPGQGVQTFSGMGALPLQVQTQGEWRFEFFESIDNVEPGADARWDDLTITLGGALDYSGATLGALATGDDAPARKRMGRNDGTNYASYYLANGPYGGGEDVYRIDHAGGRFELYLEIFANDEFPGGEGNVVNRSDLDLFLLGETGQISDIVSISANVNGMEGFDESIVIQNLAAGTYYALIDGFSQSVASYSLYTVPAPWSGAAVAVCALGVARRRR